MSGTQTLAPLDAVAKPEYKRYIFEGNFPYRKWAKLIAALSLGIGLVLFTAALFVPLLVDQPYLRTLADYLAQFAAGLISMGTVALFLLVAGYFFPPAAWSLFRFGTPHEVKKLGKYLARSWETEAPKYFKGFEDPIRKNIYYPGLHKVYRDGNQLILVVILPNGVVPGGVSRYCDAASLEMQWRLRIPVKSVAFGHCEFVDELDRKTQPDVNTATFVLTPKDYSLLSRKANLS